MKCPNCQTENREGAKYCDECGFSLSVSLDEEKTQTLPDLSEKEDLTQTLPKISETETLTQTLPKISESENLTQKLPSISVEGEQGGDLSGIEHMAEEEYLPSSFSWDAGNTMKMPAVEEVDVPQSRNFLASETIDEPKQKRSKRPLVVILALLLVAALGIGGTYYFELWGGKSIPDVLGETQADATDILTSHGFTVKVMQVKSDDVEGIVLLTDPSVGARQEEGGEVIIHVSQARVIPEVLGLSREEAEKLFEAEGLESVQFVETKSDKTENSILSVTPEVGEKVKSYTDVKVEVAVPYTVPDVSGMSLDDAKSAIKKAGFKSEVAYTYTEEKTEGTIVKTDPKAESKLKSGSTVTIYVAKSRAKEVISYTQTYFNSQDIFFVDGTRYLIDADTLDVSYEGDSTVSWSMSAQSISFDWGSLQIVYGDTQTLSGSLTWNDDGSSITSSSPSVKKG